MPSTCPKCGSGDLRMRRQNGGAYGMNSIPVGRGAKATAALDNLICVACGYVELYVSDPAVRQKIADTWDRP
jgi:ssDNA-binding Zn-finger/Zn-ribbon topoisomerase 1